jgi:hypothetical protein
LPHHVEVAPATSPRRRSQIERGPPLGPRPAASGIVSLMTFTSPPIALAPYSSVAGPRTTSIREAPPD